MSNSMDENQKPEQASDKQQRHCQLGTCRNRKMKKLLPSLSILEKQNDDDMIKKAASGHEVRKDSWTKKKNRFESSAKWKKKLFADFKGWLRDHARYSSFHGLAWYMRTDNCFIQAFIVLGAVVVMFGLPIIVSQQLYLFAIDKTVMTDVEWEEATMIKYPNITVCYAKLFDKQRLDDHNISETLATYMTFGLDTTVKQFTDFMSSASGPTYQEALDHLEFQLQDVMQANNFTDLIQLYKAVAIRCERFVQFCEEHRRFYVAPGTGFNNVPFCCGDIFDPEPFFSPAGTCFTTKADLIETFPSIFSNIRVWLALMEEHEPVFDMTFNGIDASERQGAYWALSRDDHASRTLYAKPNKVSKGTSTLVGIRIKETDRTNLPDTCLDKNNQEFRKAYNLPLTTFNCQIVQAHFLIPNCSNVVYAGINSNGIPPCSPKEVLEQKKSFGANGNLTNIEGTYFGSCPHDCHHTDYMTRISNGAYDIRTMQRFYNTNDFYKNSKAEDGAMLQFYFESFTYSKNKMHQESFFEFLAKVGGYMGFAIGGSIISFIELLGFLTHLILIIVKNLTRTDY